MVRAEREDGLDLVALFLQELQDIPQPLTREEEIALAYQTKSADPETARRAKKEMAERNLRLVAKIARDEFYGQTFLDRFQAGYFGLQRAVEKFDPNRGCRFSTYATLWIRQAIHREVTTQRFRGATYPTNILEKIGRLRRTREKLFGLLKREPTIKELAAELRTTEEKIEELFSAFTDPLSLETPVGENGDGSVLGDFMVSEGEPTPEGIAVAKISQKQITEEAFQNLTPREKEVLTKHLGLDGKRQTLEKIGKAWSRPVSRERVRQIEESALKKLRRPGELKRLKDYL